MSERWTPSLEDFVDAAGFILGAEPEAIRRLPRLALAESALHAPFASFGGVDAYRTERSSPGSSAERRAADTVPG